MKAANILIVDDDDQLSLALCDVLTAFGYEVTSRNSVSSAYSTMACGLECRAIVLDLVIGSERGEQLVARMRAHRICIPPIILTSGEPIDELKRAGHFVGACKVLQKPFAISALVETISAL